MKEQRFNVGDQVTYKSRDDCRGQYQIDDPGQYGEYYWGGDNLDGYVGIIREYSRYIESKDCYKIEVTSRDRDTYTMLECEFKEYDHKPSHQISKFKIGDIVNVNNNGYQYSNPFDYHMNDIINCDCKTIAYDAVKITDSQYSFKNNRWWYKYNGNDGNWSEESVFSKSEDKKPEYKSLVGRWVKFLRTLNDTKAGTCLLITEDYESDDCMEVKGYGAFDRCRFTNGDCELMPEGWKPKSEVNMYLIQQECMKRYPIGCRFQPIGYTLMTTLEEDLTTYQINADTESVYAHHMSGCLYKEGEWAKVEEVSLTKKMQAIQEECKRRFPIGCEYKCAMNHNRGKLKMDDYTYRIVDDSIYAHAGSGCLYKNGKYATIQLPISSTTSIGTYTGSTESMRITSSGTFLGSPCAEIHIPSRITHQKAIITKRIKKSSNKLIIK